MQFKSIFKSVIKYLNVYFYLVILKKLCAWIIILSLNYFNNSLSELHNVKSHCRKCGAIVNTSFSLFNTSLFMKFVIFYSNIFLLPSLQIYRNFK